MENINFMSKQYQGLFLLHVCILILVMFRLLLTKTLYFSSVVVLVIISSGVFRLKLSDNAGFFPVVQTLCQFGKFFRID